MRGWSVAARAARLARPPASIAPRGQSRRRCTVSFTFLEDGEPVRVAVEAGKTVLEAAHENDVDLEGACDGSLACSTCHVIFEDRKLFDSLPEPEEEELDMLDLAFDLSETSRLGCQIKLNKSMEGAVLRIPGGVNNMNK
ncbi:hypothetical protein AB1Y20_002772 [Prymnesium parvum]|uniref:2Fe-2S ferredoxin n=1 Tax=Prymnesium parvum TaxID=97485 RepID=A0AB34JA22_PRYPA